MEHIGNRNYGSSLRRALLFLGLVINVQSKRDMKQMKKLLRRAGAAKAKIRIKK